MATLKGKVGVVTGATRGIGAAIALELARQGASVLLVYTSESSVELAEALIAEIEQFASGAKARGCKVDLSTVDAPQAILAELDRWLGSDARIDILVNNAGVEVRASLSDLKVADYDKAFNLNVRAPVLVTAALLPRLNDANNRIINIGSVAGRVGLAPYGLYTASKAALEGLTRSWADELGKNGTTVNQVNPGIVQTDMLDKIPRKMVEMQKAQTPVENRVGTVQEIANTVAWLASPASSWISGQVISASGGWAMY
ncbi:dehydrogenase with different specificitie [Cercophora scortea]|uniref:3-oxoacyl-[acyl-carrier-protein] reductase n=1 Tax=Cercophora scortea TaxID=314031 RepID=A0AAE0MI38_9PEZI|nr:dehydrogenase with different specificitie [Cercophora scortea]